MAAGSTSRIIHNPGKLVVDPTDLNLPDPYGGTEVGLVNQVLLTELGVSRRIENEGLGEASDVLEGNKRAVFGFFLRGWDDDAVLKFFKGEHSTGAVTQHAVYTYPGTRVPGESTLDDTSVVVLFVPENLIDTNALVIYRGIPLWSDDSEQAFQKQEEFGIPLMIDCLRNGSGNIFQEGRLADISLT